MVLHWDNHDASDNEDDVVNTAEKVPRLNVVKTWDGRTEGLQQHAFITKHDIFSIYKIKEKLGTAEGGLEAPTTQEAEMGASLSLWIGD